MSVHVRIVTRQVGIRFGTIGIVLDASSGKELATTDVLPFGFHGTARDLAEEIASRNKWTVLKEKST